MPRWWHNLPMNSASVSSISYHRLLRTAGVATWLILGLPILSASTRAGESVRHGQWVAWVLLFLIFGPAFWFASTSKPIPLAYRVGALLLQTFAVLGMTYLFQDYFVGFLLVMVSWLLALYLPLNLASLWVVAQTVLLLYFLEPHYHMGWRWAATSAYLGFQVFALATAAIAKEETAARQAEAAVNAELMSTRELLTESSRLGERVRIARELHDVLGHHLTALALQLEVALHSPSEQVRSCVEKAQSSSGHLLTELREVVSAFRDSERIDVRRAISVLADRVPHLKLHLEMLDDLRITEPARAHVVLRCVQEITTNTLKHANAANLWIDIRMADHFIEINAHDDGRGIRNPMPGRGLSGMRERLEELGGGVTFGASAESGFSVRAWLPLPQGADAV